MSKAEEMPIDSRGIKILAHSTIRSWTEAIVELLTNSDDAYKRLENKTKISLGEIDIFMSRENKGSWKMLEVRDEAGGISREGLNSATSFFADSNEYDEHKNVRGFFGRGLKETIVALGIGEVITIKDKKLNVVKIWNDSKTKKTYRHFIIENEEVTSATRKEYKIKENGTLIRIKINNPKIKIPELKTLEQQLKKHISLRDIFSSKNRDVKLTFKDIRRGTKHKFKIAYEFPESKKVLNKKLNVPGYKEEIELRVYETNEKLEYKRHSAFNTAGILIKTKGAILDNQLFKFENDNASHYFYGECISPKIDELLRTGDTSILNPSRSGIEWSNDYSQLLMKTIERALDPLIEEKKKELAKKKKVKLSKENQKLFNELSKLFDNIFKEELGDGEIEITPDEVFEEKIFIKPEVTNLIPRIQRTLCVYAHENIVKREGEKVEICSIRKKVSVLNESVYLERHKKYPNMFIGKFKVKGWRVGDEDVIEAMLGEERTLCEVKVKEKQGTKTRTNNPPKPPKKGNITGFEHNLEPSPIQRAQHNKSTGKIIIYTQFPGVSSYLGEQLENMSDESAKMLLCGIVCDAMFRRIIDDKFQKGDLLGFGGADFNPSSYESERSELQKKYINRVYSLVMNYDFENKEDE